MREVFYISDQESREYVRNMKCIHYAEDSFNNESVLGSLNSVKEFFERFCMGTYITISDGNMNCASLSDVMVNGIYYIQNIWTNKFREKCSGIARTNGMMT